MSINIQVDKLVKAHDKIRHFETIKKAAEDENIDAQYKLGFLYREGEGTKVNLEKSCYWFQKAAESGNKDAMNSLAECYHGGVGTEKNLEKAFHWFQKAFENGNEDVINRLAFCYY